MTVNLKKTELADTKQLLLLNYLQICRLFRVAQPDRTVIHII